MEPVRVVEGLEARTQNFTMVGCVKTFVRRRSKSGVEG